MSHIECCETATFGAVLPAMFHVYTLRSERDKGLYIGYTTNIRNRLEEHNEGSVISTKARRPLRLIFLESYINKADAVRRERYLKTTIGKKMLKGMLRNTLRESISLK